MLINLLILSVAVFLVANFLPGIQVKHFGTAIMVAIVYSLVNFFFGWLLIFLSLPFIILLGKPPPQVGDSKSLTVPGVEIKQPSLS